MADQCVVSPRDRVRGVFLLVSSLALFKSGRRVPCSFLWVASWRASGFDLVD